jgi:hypothetical protein
MTQTFDLAGSYRLHPGAANSITGQRPVMGAGTLGRLLRGREAAAVEPLLGQLFSLCAHAHRRSARLVLQAARTPEDVALPGEPPVFLALETARDHLRSMVLDWPRQQSGPAPAQPLAWLKDCPLTLKQQDFDGHEDPAWETLGHLRRWLEERVLGQPVTQWLAQHRDDQTLAAWCQAHAGALPPLQALAHWKDPASALRPLSRPLDLLDTDPQQQAANLHELVLVLAADPDFAQKPTWRGQNAETGPWTRLRHRNTRNAEPTAWTRLAARWTELLEIAAMPDDGSAPLLSSGALHLGAGQAIAWCEMARGLLLHWVQLDAQGLVRDYRVLAPTEWNFHPQGALAQALTGLTPQDSASARTLAAAFDACVDCQVDSDPAESRHA